MRILSLDSAGQACAVCVWEDGKVLALAEERMERGQDARLVPLLVEVMARAKTEFPALDRIAVTRGPGSFTGLRIGLATARGLGLAADKPVVGIDRFSLYREQWKAQSENLLVVLNSKRQELFCRFYPSAGAPQDALMMLPSEIAAFAATLPRLILVGDAAELLSVPLPEQASWHQAPEEEVVTSAALAARAPLNDPAFLPRPLYLRAPDVTVNAA